MLVLPKGPLPNDSPQANYPQSDELPPQSVLLKLELVDLQESNNGVLYEAKIIDVIRYGRQAPLISKGNTISILCSDQCSEEPPSPQSTITAIIIARQHMNIGETSDSNFMGDI
ncbi:MAG: hypothetical protein U5K71_02135 [Gracilimonas sp.]|nr:hypothetical protein [Gracilimonas sp.]